MKDRRLGWFGGGLVVVGLVLIVVGSTVGGVVGYRHGVTMGSGAMMGSSGMMDWGPGSSTAPVGKSVRTAGSRFELATLTVAPGSTVRWFNADALPHTVTAADGSWDSGDLPPGGPFERRFDAVGTYGYLCRYHPGMVATIVVTAA